jgi:hypothetical protein
MQVTDNKSWICGYNPEVRQQSSQYRNSNSPSLKEMKQLKNKVKRMLVVFFDMKGIVNK